MSLIRLASADYFFARLLAHACLLAGVTLECCWPVRRKLLEIDAACWRRLDGLNARDGELIIIVQLRQHDLVAAQPPGGNDGVAQRVAFLVLAMGEK